MEKDISTHTACPCGTTGYVYYAHDYKGIRLDPYRIMLVYGITHPAHQHALKKLLRAGKSSKDLRTDLIEARDTIDRFLQMIEEDT